jgi:hypothetical protein
MICVFIEILPSDKTTSSSNNFGFELYDSRNTAGSTGDFVNIHAVRFILVIEFENRLAESGNDPRFHLMPAQLGKSLAPSADIRDFPSGENCFVAFQ